VKYISLVKHCETTYKSVNLPVKSYQLIVYQLIVN